ncbi:penicillin acylase family protein [Caenimonas sp. SL110]|uniref:penicillin acylase family protein n=1 Tax=Caenimonas sp. SL110 TaxID=1450524 RepID=UPI0006539F21|nr:penicillin acylase family protein [Caenimonas sp. SL110]
MRVLKFTLLGIVALALLAALMVAGYVWRAFPTLDGQIRAQGLKSPVEVRRDEADVTHIEAQSLADAYFALGYVHAQERGWQLEFNRRVMHGQLSELFGQPTLDTDRTMRKLGILRAAQGQWARMAPETQALVKAYVGGINSFHATSSQALPPEFHILRTQPGEWTPQDSLGWAIMMALDLGGNWGTEFARFSALQRLDTAQLWQLMPPYPGEAPATSVDLAALYKGLGVYRPADAKTAIAPAEITSTSLVASMPDLDRWTQGLGHLEGIGSNNWVVHGSRTQTGKPLLANDPHLGLSAPAIWYFARLKAPAMKPGGKPVDVIGATFPGLPSVVLGRTAGVSWGVTNTGPDVQDLYLEQINPDNPKQYRTPTGWAEFASREETIRIKGQPDEKLVVRTTRHGPVMSDANAGYANVLDTRKFALALRWSALDADNQTLAAGIDGNTAQTVDELLAAYANYHSPMQNMVAADTGGKTAYQAVGRVPVRGEGNDLRGIAPAPGWDAKYDWTGWIAASDNPRVDHAAIEAKGWHATANQRIHPADFPRFIGADWNTPERFDRIEALLGAQNKHTAQTMRDVHADTLSTATLKLLPFFKATASSHALAPAAMDQFRVFDGNMRAEIAAPLIFAYWADELTRGLVIPRIGEAKFKALYGKRTFRAALELMLLDAEVGKFWCAPVGCAEQSSRALGRALDRIAAEQGKDVAAWRWGRAHPALSAHRPFGNVPSLATYFDVSVPTAGDPWTVNVGQYWANDTKTPFANRHAASMRTVFDLADPERSQFIYQTGQSGLVFSSRYRDMKDQWAQVEYRPLRLNPPKWAHQSTLEPQ